MLIKNEVVYRANEDCSLERLFNVARATNAYIERGESCVACLGHSRDSDDTLSVSVGTLNNFRVEGDELVADITVDKLWEDARELKSYKKKSVELWSDDVISSVALLAKNRPALELGLVAYEMPKREGEHANYTIENEDNDMNADEVKAIVADTLMHSDLAAAVKALGEQLTDVKLMSEKLNWLFEDEGEQVGPDGEPISDPEKDGLDEGEEGLPKVEGEPEGEIPGEEKKPEDEATEPEGEKVIEGEKEEKVEKPEEKDEMALASGTNTFVPTTETKKKKYEELELEVQQYSMEADNQKKLVSDYASRIEKAENEKQTIEAERVALERKYSMLNRKLELVSLSAKYQFDPEEEIKIVETMDDSQFETHKNLVVKRYAMPPVSKAPVTPAALKDDDEVIPANEVLKITRYALEHKCTWLEAKARMKG